MQSLKQRLEAMDPAFASELAAKTREARDFGELLQLCTLRRRALARGLLTPPEKSRRVAIMGGANLRPMVDLIEHFAAVLGGIRCEIWVGEYDNYQSEIMDPESPLYKFKPDVTLLLPSEKRCTYDGPLTAPRAEHESAGQRVVTELLGLCRAVHERTGSEVVLGNFRFRRTSILARCAARHLSRTMRSASL